MKQHIELNISNNVIRGFRHINDSDTCTVMFHGYTGNKSENGKFEKIGEVLNTDIIRFDLFAHGESDGDFIDLDYKVLLNQAQEVINYTKTLGYKKINLLGFSMGGTICLHLLDETINKVYLISPAFGFVKLVENQFKNLQKYDENTVLIGVRKLNKHFLESLYTHFNILKHQKTYQNKIICMYGSNDMAIDIKELNKEMPNYLNSEVIEIENADHTYTKLSYQARLLDVIKDN